MYSKNYRQKKAFTLAEVLVTLAVIGIVAALTIPTLIKNYEKSQIIAGVKKYSSLLNQAVNMYMANNGCTGNLTACDAFSANHAQAWNELKPYFKIVKNCGTATGLGCFAPGVTYKFLDGNNFSFLDNTVFGKGILTDGASILIDAYSSNCPLDHSRSDNTPLLNICGTFQIDINGHKGPNQLGKDFFAWYITKSGAVFPLGIPDDLIYTDGAAEPDCDPYGAAGNANPGGGFGCSGYIMTKGNTNYLD